MTARDSRGEADFLGRLLERSREEGGALRPRLPGLFEPAAPAAAVGELGVQEEATVFPAQTRAPAAPYESVAAPPNRAARAASGEAEPAFAPAVWGTRSNVRASLAEPERAAPGGGALALTALRVSAPSDETEPALAAASRAPARRAAPALEPRAEADVPAPEPASMSMPSRAVEPRRAAEEGAAALARPPESLLTAPPAVVRSIAALSKSFEPRASRESSTINVSIGRLEVRATQASKPAAKPARPNAVGPLSLDDYLKQTGGRR